jgi:hypothetical protein
MFMATPTQTASTKEHAVALRIATRRRAVDSVARVSRRLCQTRHAQTRRSAT